MVMQPKVTTYAGQVSFSARIADLLSGSGAGDSGDASVRVPGRITSLEIHGAERIRGILRHAGEMLKFASPASLFGGVKPFDIVLLSGRMSDTPSGKLFEVDGVETLTPSAVQDASLASWGETALEDRRTKPEYDFIFATDRGKVLQRRPKIMQATRHFLDGRGFLEVDTPFLVPWPDIAPVPPVTVSAGRYVPASDLRIANTEFMRRLLVAGFDRIYQLGRCFRDERPSPKHEIEFTQLTFGVSFATYETLIGLIEDLTCHLLESLGRTHETNYQGTMIDFRRPWRRVTVQDGLKAATGVDVLGCHDHAALKDAVRRAGIEVPAADGGYGGLLAQARLLDALIDEHVIPTFDGPTWLCEYPFYLGGPAKEILGRPQVKMRAELFVNGLEIANISVPQNDPAKVRSWYEEMYRLKCEKGWDTPFLDEPYLRAMEIGIPVATTGGLGFDRLLMVLLDVADVRDVLLFQSGAQYRCDREDL